MIPKFTSADIISYHATTSPLNTQEGNNKFRADDLLDLAKKSKKSRKIKARDLGQRASLNAEKFKHISLYVSREEAISQAKLDLSLTHFLF